ncbi:hypothetical protein ACH4UT_20265 [Streptomyces sp. NPDC020799]|uniref:hypothetical protein n=1 Tax=Streptomyces sp. NPDC020799 TaxID=3365091 RepID=UPI0037897D2B
MVGETVVIRGLAAAAAAAAVVGAVLMRRWDRAAGKRVAQLNAARVRDEWKTDERIAELETELEEARAGRAKAETKLRGKRAEIARLRTEHADLLRRYAAAETGRASALEGRRQAQGSAPRSAKALESAAASAGTAGSAVAASAYRKAAEALRDLERNGAIQRDAEATATESGQDAPPALTDVVPPSGLRAPGTGETLSAADAARAAKRRTGAKAAEETGTARDTEGAQDLQAAKAAKDAKTQTAPVAPEAAEGATAPEAAEGATAPVAPRASNAGEEAEDRAADATDEAPAEKRMPPAARPASAVVPQQHPARRPAPRTQGGFDFFGTQRTPSAARPVEETDLADVVGEEALAEAEAAEQGDDSKGDVIDLTAHDETEQIDVVELRSAIS